MLPVPGVRRIAILRASALGDLVVALPAFDAVRAAYPAAEIVLLARGWHAALLGNRPGPIDRVIPLPAGIPARDGGSGEDAALASTVERLQAEEFDLAVQLHGGGRTSNPLVASLGARLTVGARTPDALPLDRTIPFHHYQPEVFRALEVVGLAGAAPNGFEPRLAVVDGDRKSLRRAIPRLPDAPAPVAVLHPGAGDPRRRWRAEAFSAVGRALVTAGATVVVTGTDRERDLVERVADEARAMSAAGCLDLPGLVGLLARASVVVANDTGPLHLAAAVGAATVGIFWCGNLINAGPPFRRRHRPHAAWTLHCPACGVDCTRADCPHRASFVADVPAQGVIDDALDLLAQGRTDTGRTHPRRQTPDEAGSGIGAGVAIGG